MGSRGQQGRGDLSLLAGGTGELLPGEQWGTPSQAVQWLPGPRRGPGVEPPAEAPSHPGRCRPPIPLTRAWRAWAWAGQGGGGRTAAGLGVPSLVCTAPWALGWWGQHPTPRGPRSQREGPVRGCALSQGRASGVSPGLNAAVSAMRLLTLPTPDVLLGPGSGALEVSLSDPLGPQDSGQSEEGRLDPHCPGGQEPQVSCSLRGCVALGSPLGGPLGVTSGDLCREG